MDKKCPIFFFIRSAGYLKTFHSVIRSLISRGHIIVAAFDPSPRELDSNAIKILDDFSRENPGFEWIKGVKRGGIWKRILRPVRELLNYRRFLVLRKRAYFYEDICFKFLPIFIQKIIKSLPFFKNALKSSAVKNVLVLVEWIAPAEKNITNQILSKNPSVVLVAFRNRPSSSPDLDYIKSAKKLGIPVVIPTPSWDNLSSKGLIQIHPDKLLVWNKEQKDEAIEHHKINPNRISIVGSYQFDEWRMMQNPPDTRDEWLKKIGLSPKQEYVLYLGSGAVTGDSTAVVEELRRGMDESEDKRVSSMAILVRPAPNNFVAFDGFNKKGVVIFPKSPVSLSTDIGKDILLKSIYYSIAAVTIHTTGIIDAMLRGKPGFVILRPEYEKLQHAEHFAHLLKSGAAISFRDGNEFARNLSDILSGKDKASRAREDFIQKFILPPDGYKTAGECAADEIEKLL